MKVIFMGTPEFACPAFEKIIASKNHEIVAVFTQKPKARGRGLQVKPSPVHQVADKHNIPIHNPESLRSVESSQLINSIDADIIVVVAYGFVIPAGIINSKRFGCINLHPSKLPKYRGAAPLQRTIIDGNDETSVCIMQMDEGLDTGDIILQEDFKISQRITLPELHDKCAALGAEMIIQVLDNIEKLPRKKQSEDGVIYAHKLSKEESKIDWQESAFKIDCKIRGMNPWPGVYFQHDGKNVKIIAADYRQEKHSYIPGQLINDDFDVACGDGILQIKIIQPAGKSKMSAQDYLRGIQNREEIIIFS